MSKSARRPITLTLKEKLEVIKSAEGGKSSRELAKQFGVGKTQIGNIIKRKAEIIELDRNNAPLGKRRCIRATGYEDVNQLTYAWFCNAMNLKIKVNGSMLQRKALQFAQEIGRPSFKASNGWKESFIKRYNITFGKVCGEQGSGVSQMIVSDWQERLSSIIKGYSARDIYNMDESSLYYKITQDKNFYERRENPTGGKKSKERVTISLCVNMAGEREPLLFIAKTATQRAFKSLDPKMLPVMYRYNKEAWMNTTLFSSWLHAFNQKMMSQGRSVLLFLDSAPSHEKEKLSNVTLCYLPANLFMLQPLNQGIIQTLKLKYREKQFQHIMLEMLKDNKTELEIMGKVNILQAVLWIAEAWKQVSEETITKGFRSCGFNKQSTEEAADSALANVLPTPPEFSMLSEQLTGLPFESLASIDEDVPTEDIVAIDWTRPKLDILQDIKLQELERQVTGDNSDNEEDLTPKEMTTVKEALTALSTLKKFFWEKSVVSGLINVQNLDQDIFDCVVKSSVQCKIEI